MSNSNNKKTSSKPTSFNKSKSKSISDAMRDLEIAKPVQDDFDFDETNNDILKEESIDEEYFEIGDSSIDFGVESERSILASKMEGINLEDLEKDSSSSDVNINDNSESDIEDLLDDIFVSPDEGVIESSSDSESYFNQETEDKEISDLMGDDVFLHKPKLKSKPVDLSKRVKSTNSKDSANVFNIIKSRITVESIRGIFSSRSKILALLGIIIGLIIIIYGFMSFSNVSDRVVDHVLLGEAGSWSIFIILIGLIIILLDVFFVVYYKQSLKNSSISNSKLRSTFNTIDKIKSIDSDYYEDDEFDNVSIKDFFKGKQGKESPTNIKNSIFDDETINSYSKTDINYAVDDDNLKDNSDHVDSLDDE